ncbi:MAG TPA: rhamnogalacturonan acetylesterase [Opitutaceae bacterium]|nr:rhamnogalacturonan acetylesterase [Opitutaceae bacterium]
MNVPRSLLRGALLAAGLSTVLSPLGAAERWKFDFGAGAVAPGFTPVLPEMAYSAERGFGFELGSEPVAGGRAGGDPLTSDFVTSAKPFLFSAAVPEGNYRVTVTLGDPAAESVTTIKAELRRLMVERLAVPAGQTRKVSFIVNTRSPKIAAAADIKAGEVNLKKPREIELEAFAWDDKLTLEFNNTHPAICAVEIEPVQVPTIFVLGDSTVCDQPREPFASWGQMLTRFFKPEVAIANHGESGESYSASLSRRRIDKICSQVQPGDVVIMQFGHNDQKERGENAGPFKNYKENIRKHVEMVRAHGGIPVIVSPMERRAFDADGKVRQSLADYAQGAEQAAKENNVAFIDLHAWSIPFYETLEVHGKDYSRKAFAGQDNTHSDNYGAYEFAKVIAQGLRDNKIALAKYLVDDFAPLDPHHPDPVETFPVPASGGAEGPRPLGN